MRSTCLEYYNNVQGMQKIQYFIYKITLPLHTRNEIHEEGSCHCLFGIRASIGNSQSTVYTSSVLALSIHQPSET